MSDKLVIDLGISQGMVWQLVIAERESGAVCLTRENPASESHFEGFHSYQSRRVHDCIVIPAEHRQAVCALLAPEPEPTMLGMDPLESVSEYREDRLKITFTPSPHRPNELMVKLAGSWTGLTLVRLNVTDGAAWIVPQRPQLGPFRVRGEAVAAAIVTTFDPDNDQTPEPEPSDAEVEAASKALYRRAFPWDEHNETSDEFRAIAKAVLLAARAARQTGGA